MKLGELEFLIEIIATSERLTFNDSYSHYEPYQIGKPVKYILL